MTIDEWLTMGYEKGYCSAYCYTHDHPFEDDEYEFYIEDADQICIPIVRVMP